VELHACPCCGSSALHEPPPGTFQICPVCGWEDDNVQFDDPTCEGGANQISLNRARANFLATGRADSSTASVRSAIIDGASIHSRDDLHEVLARVLELPEHYGRNLDALWDCLTGWMAPPVEIVWREFALSRARLGGYAEQTLEVLRRATGEVPSLTVRVEEQAPAGVGSR